MDIIQIRLAEQGLEALAKTVTNRGQLFEALYKLHINLSSPRTHSATRRFEDGESVHVILHDAVQNECNARLMWFSQLEQWCNRHKITIEQGLSVLFDDDSFDPNNHSTDRVTKRTMFEWSGQQNDFAPRVLAEVLLYEKTVPPCLIAKTVARPV